MDKLQPIIQQRFWILLVICLGLATFGYFKGQAAMVTATKAREEVLTKIKSEISKGQEPNQDYQRKLGHINTEYDKLINESIKELFQAQKDLMWWPDRVASLIPRVHGAEIIPDTRIKYGREYQNLIDELWTKVEPVVAKEVPGQRPQPVRGGREEKPVKVTWTQKVYCEKEGIPQKFFGGKYIAPEAVWDAQEDIWFVERIFEAIRAVNQSADSPISAVVRKVNLLTLRGGDGETGGGEADAMSADSSSDDYSKMSMSMNRGATPMGQTGAAGTGLGGMGAEFTAPVAFDPAEEFGSDAAPLEASESSEDEGASFSAMNLRGGGMMGAGPDVPTLRWYKLDLQAPYRERAFYLSVIMQQSQIPDFMIALLDSPWPIRIARFQMGPNPHFQEVEGQSSGGGYGGYGPNSLSGDDGGRGSIGGRRPGLGSMGGTAAPMMGAGRSGSSSIGMGTMGSMPGIGGRSGYGMQARQPGAGLAFINTPADPFAGSLNSPDLVQLDIAGVITFYVETKDDGTAAIETSAVDSQSAVPADEATADEGVAPTDGDPAAEPSANGDTPVEDAAPMDTSENPAAEPAPTETPPADETAPAAESAPATDDPDAASAPESTPAEEPAAPN